MQGNVTVQLSRGMEMLVQNYENASSVESLEMYSFSIYQHV